MNRYRIPKERVRVEYRVSNSRFIATIAPIANVDEAKRFIASIREEMPDASHHVYAFRVGYGASVIEGMSDDGEPGGTAGPPALAVLRGTNVGDVALVITRYFGGTKLGTGGLVSAYSEAAKIAFADLETEEKVQRTRLELSVPYAHHAAVRRALDAHNSRLVHEDFATEINLTFDVPVESVDSLNAALRDLSSGKLTANSS